MNKTEYLKELKESLKDIDESVMGEIVSDYEEHFRIGRENGKGEDQICKGLGSIDDLVQEIREAYSAKESDGDSSVNRRNGDNGKDKRGGDVILEAGSTSKLCLKIITMDT